MSARSSNSSFPMNEDTKDTLSSPFRSPYGNQTFTSYELPIICRSVRGARNFLGGEATVARLNGESVCEGFLRPTDPNSHPINGRAQNGSSFVVRVKKRSDSVQSPNIEYLGSVRKTFTFDGMSDFQYLSNGVPSNISKDILYELSTEVLTKSIKITSSSLDPRHMESMDSSDVLKQLDKTIGTLSAINSDDDFMNGTPPSNCEISARPTSVSSITEHIGACPVIPPTFLRYDIPSSGATFDLTTIQQYNQSVGEGFANLSSPISTPSCGNSAQYLNRHRKSNMTSVVSAQSMFDPAFIVPQRNMSFLESDKAVNFPSPSGVVNVTVLSDRLVASELLPSGSVPSTSSQRIQEAFQLRPVWSLHQLYVFLGIPENGLRFLLPQYAYYLKSVPFRQVWVRLGYDPRSDPNGFLYETIELIFSENTGLSSVALTRLDASARVYEAMDGGIRDICPSRTLPAVESNVSLFPSSLSPDQSAYLKVLADDSISPGILQGSAAKDSRKRTVVPRFFAGRKLFRRATFFFGDLVLGTLVGRQLLSPSLLNSLATGIRRAPLAFSAADSPFSPSANVGFPATHFIFDPNGRQRESFVLPADFLAPVREALNVKPFFSSENASTGFRSLDARTIDVVTAAARALVSGILDSCDLPSRSDFVELSEVDRSYSITSGIRKRHRRAASSSSDSEDSNDDSDSGMDSAERDDDEGPEEGDIEL